MLFISTYMELSVCHTCRFKLILMMLNLIKGHVALFHLRKISQKLMSHVSCHSAPKRPMLPSQ